jgi:oxygen-dependent protoporphyrinogen oxidase
LRTGARVRALDRTDGGHRVSLEGGEVLHAERVVVACPPPAAAELIGAHDRAHGELHGELPYAAVAVVHVGIERIRVGHALDGFGFLVCAGEELRCLGCVFESSLWPGRAPEGSVLLRVLYGGARDPVAPTLPDEALQALALAELERALELRGPPAFVQVVKHARAIPQYVVGHASRVAEIERRAAALGLLLCGSGYRGVSVNDCVKDAALVAERVTRG